MKKVFVLSIASPLLVGVYDESNNLIEAVQKEGYASDVLVAIFDSILKKYQIDAVYYVNGPGSFMAIKVAFVFLRTLAICHNMAMYAANGFEFNARLPIKAIGKKVFIQNEYNEIVLEDAKSSIFAPFSLPLHLDQEIFSDDIGPKYYLPAV